MDAPSVWTLHSYAEVDLDIVGRTERALALLPETDSPLRCRMLGALAAELYDGSDDPRCDAFSAEAVGMARRLEDPRLLASSLHNRYQAVNQPRFAAEMVELGQELAELGATEGMPAYELLGHEVGAMYRMQLFDVAGADAESAAADPLLRRLSLRPMTAIHNMWLALRLLLDGRLTEAEEAYERSLAEHRRLGFFGTEALADVIHAMLDTANRRWDAVASQLDSLAVVAPLFAESLRAWTLAESGQVAQAHALLDAQSPAALKDWSYLPLLATASEAALAAGHTARMHWCYEQLLPYSGWLAVGGNTVAFGPVDYYLARLAAALGDATASDEHRTRAESDCRGAGLMWWAERAAGLAPKRATSHPQVVR
jgi:hypothetical protein